MIKTAVIMAAGKGTRFGSMAETKPKGFIDFNGIPMVVRSVENLISAGIERIIIGTGYHHEWYDELSKIYPQIEIVFSPRFAETNSMETLARCKDAIAGDDFLLLESDIVYEKKGLDILLTDEHPDVMLVTPVTKFQDQYYIGCDDEGYLAKCSTDREDIVRETGEDPVGELVGIHKISNSFYKDMLEVYAYRHRWEELFHNGEHPEKTGYEYILENVATWRIPKADYADKNGNYPVYPSGGLFSSRPLYVLIAKTLQWYEIDDQEDLNYAEKNISV